MNSTLSQQIRARFDAEASLLGLDVRIRQLEAEAKQADQARRDQLEKLLNYQSGIRGVIDRLRGTREAREEALSLELRRLESRRDDLLRQLEALHHEYRQVSAQLEQLPPWEVLREQAAGDPEYYRLEAKFCIEALKPLVEENAAALFALRSLMRGDRAGELLSNVDVQAIHSAPNTAAQKCIPLLQRLKIALDALHIPFEFGSYYDSPAAFLVSSAAEHTRRDRVNQAMDQVSAVKKQLAALAENS